MESVHTSHPDTARVLPQMIVSNDTVLINERAWKPRHPRNGIVGGFSEEVNDFGVQKMQRCSKLALCLLFNQGQSLYVHDSSTRERNTLL